MKPIDFVVRGLLGLIALGSLYALGLRLRAGELEWSESLIPLTFSQQITEETVRWADQPGRFTVIVAIWFCVSVGLAYYAVRPRADD